MPGPALGIGAVPSFGGAAAFSPLSLSPFIWLRADLGITIGTGVSAWADQSGNGHDVTQATGANQPAFNANDAAYGGKPTVQSTATNMFLSSGAFVMAQPFSVFVVGEYSTAGGVFIGNAVQLFDSAGSSSIFAGATLTDAVSHNTKRALLGSFNGGASLAGASDWVSGGTAGAAGATAVDKISLFALASGAAGTIGKVAEFIGLPRTPTAGDKSSLAAYFLSQYGISVT